MPIGTAFHERTLELCHSLNYREWSGYYTVSVYEVHHEHEYNAIRNACALIDISPLYKYLITGKDATKLVNRIITRDINKVKVGQVIYCCWCDEQGKVIDDGTITRLEENVYRWTAADPSLRWFRQNGLNMDVQVEDISEQVAALALQGPTSAKLLKAVCDADIANLKYFRKTSGKINGVPVDISRTGYTGDLGYEIWVDTPDATAVWDTVWDVADGHGVLPYGMGALYMLRIEAGLLLLGADFDSSRFAFNDAHRSTPLELGWAWMFKGLEDDDRPFIGRKALERERAEKSSRWRMVGLVVDWQDYDRAYSEAGLIPPKDHRPVHEDWMVYDADRSRVGYATSIMYSPVLQQHIALARVRPDLGKAGTRVFLEFTVDHHYEQVAAHVARLPLYNPERKTA